MQTFLYWLPLIVVVGLALIAFTALAFSMRDQRDKRVAARRDGLREAEAALRSIANIAEAVARQRDDQSLQKRSAEERSYYYGRAAQIVASIPKDRL